MFRHLFLYRLRCLLRSRANLFWTLLFPIFLATAFHFSFGQMLTGGSPEPIMVAVVDDAAYREDHALAQMLTALAAPGESQLLKLTMASSESAKALLDEGDVAGVIAVGPAGPMLTVNRSGLNQSVLKAVLDEYLQTATTFAHLAEQNPQAMHEMLPRLLERVSFTREISFSDAEPNIMLSYFYALIAMTCLSGSYWGLQNSTQTQANLSAHGMRRSVAPTPKLRIVLSDTAAAVVVTFAEVLVLMAYMIGALKVDFGSQILFVLLVGFVGSLNGVALGTFVGTVFRQSENAKQSLLTGLTLSLSFLAGLMFVNIKDIVMQKAPLLSYINPAALVTDAFYSLYIFSSHQRFYLNLGLLTAITALLCLGSFLCLRSERYVSV